MLHIFICDDEQTQCDYIKNIVTDHILMESLDMNLAFITGSPVALLDYLKEHPNDHRCNDYGLYFLDINLSHELNGIQLAAKIREYEPSSHIVFITSHAELSHLTFRYKVGAMDYITKDFPEEVAMRIRECIDTAYARHLMISTSSKSGGFPVPIGDTIRVIPLNEIMFFEAHPSYPHRLILHMEKSQLEFRSALNKVAESVSDFYRCHKSYLVNLSNIVCVDASRRTAEMVNGESVLIASRKFNELAGLLKLRTDE